MTVEHQSKFDNRQIVIVDGHRDLVATVTGVLIRDGGYVLYEVSWVNGGVAVTAFIEEYRLEAVLE